MTKLVYLNELMVSTEDKIGELKSEIVDQIDIIKNSTKLVEAIERLGEIESLIFILTDGGLIDVAYIQETIERTHKVLLSTDENYTQEEILEAKAILKLYNEMGY